MVSCTIPQGLTRRTFWTTQVDACGSYDSCGYNCGVPGLKYVEPAAPGCDCCGEPDDAGGLLITIPPDVPYSIFDRDGSRFLQIYTRTKAEFWLGSVTAMILLAGGGGSGGYTSSGSNRGMGGGGAGGLFMDQVYLPAGHYYANVGKGAPENTGSSLNGGDTSLSGMVAYIAQGGGSAGTFSEPPADGGCGAGGSDTLNEAYPPGKGSQGGDGGIAEHAGANGGRRGGGGGGMGGDGLPGIAGSKGGDGGPGVYVPFLEVPVWIGGGGGGYGNAVGGLNDEYGLGSEIAISNYPDDYQAHINAKISSVGCGGGGAFINDGSRHGGAGSDGAFAIVIHLPDDEHLNITTDEDGNISYYCVAGEDPCENPVKDRTLATDDWLRSLIINMLMTNGRMPDTQCGYLPGTQGGHWSESYITGGQQTVGTLMRTVPAMGSLQENLALISAYASSTLQRLVNYGVAVSVDVTATYMGNLTARLDIVVNGVQGNPARVGLTTVRSGNEWVWS